MNKEASLQGTAGEGQITQGVVPQMEGVTEAEVKEPIIAKTDLFGTIENGLDTNPQDSPVIRVLDDAVAEFKGSEPNYDRIFSGCSSDVLYYLALLPELLNNNSKLSEAITRIKNSGLEIFTNLNQNTLKDKQFLSFFETALTTYVSENIDNLYQGQEILSAANLAFEKIDAPDEVGSFL